MKALVHHNPTEEDISHVLREFTVDFLLKGYGSLVAVLQEQLSLNASVQMDKSHFLWLITYFLKFASQMELDLDHISPVLSTKILSYLTYEGVAMCENLTVCKGDLKPHLRRMHLVVTALREFVQAVEIYSKSPSSSREDKQHITMLQSKKLPLFFNVPFPYWRHMCSYVNVSLQIKCLV
jgi:timeless protein